MEFPNVLYLNKILFYLSWYLKFFHDYMTLFCPSKRPLPRKKKVVLVHVHVPHSITTTCNLLVPTVSEDSIIIIIIRIPALKCSSSMLRPQLRLCRMAWVRGEGRESNKATNIYEIGHNNMKRTNLHMHDCTRMETTKYNGYNHCATKPVHRRSVDNVTKHKTQLLNTGSTK